MSYEGIIIEESLRDLTILQLIKITDTAAVPVTKAHKTPWLTQWTVHSATIPAQRIDTITKMISRSLLTGRWYADFKSKSMHYIIFPNKVFKVNPATADGYRSAINYGRTLDIPEYQLDFAPSR